MTIFMQLFQNLMSLLLSYQVFSGASRCPSLDSLMPSLTAALVIKYRMYKNTANSTISVIKSSQAYRCISAIQVSIFTLQGR